MDVHLTPELAARLDKLSAETGRPKDELVQDVMAGYFEELEQIRQMLQSRYDDIESGRVKPIDGNEFFENLRKREEELLKQRSGQ